MDNPPLKPFGRSLKNFDELKPAEQKLLEACRKGELADISEARPEKADKNNIVRADFVRFLALGGDEQNPVHEMGLHLRGAWIEDDLNLGSVTLPHNLCLDNCHLKNIDLSNSNIEGVVSFSGCHVSGLEASSMRCSHSIFLNDGFIATGTVRFINAQIADSLDCKNATFKVEGGVALVCDGAVINGCILLNDNFSAIGAVCLVSVQIGKNLVCQKATFNNTSGYSLVCDSAVINGNVFLSDDFTAIGTVKLSGMRIGGSLICEKAIFDGSNDIALVAEGMTVRGVFHFYNLRSVKGKVLLGTTKVGTLIDNIHSWVSELNLDGFVYDNLSSVAHTDAF